MSECLRKTLCRHGWHPEHDVCAYCADERALVQEVRDLISALEYAAEDFEAIDKPRAAKACRSRADHALAMLAKATGKAGGR